MKSGERQVSSDPEQIDVWHRWRYSEASKLILPGEKVIDYGCGIGYGTKTLAEKSGFVIGIDDSIETIDFASANYSAKNIEYVCSDLTRIGGLVARCDVAVAFEILEHLESPDDFLWLVKMYTKRLFILSVPHISVDLEKSDWHYKHYELEEVRSLVEMAGFSVTVCKVMMFSKGEAIFCIGERKPC